MEFVNEMRLEFSALPENEAFARLAVSGFLLPLAYPRLNRLWKAILTGVVMSLCIELLQLPISSRVSDMDDLILNTLGFLLGYGLCAALQHGLRRAKK